MKTITTEILLKIYEKTELSKQDSSYQSIYEEVSELKEFQGLGSQDFKKLFDSSVDILISWHMIYQFYEPQKNGLKKCFKIDDEFKDFAKISYDHLAEGIAETLLPEQRRLLNQFCCGRNFLSSVEEEHACMHLEDCGLVKFENNLPNAQLCIPTVLGEQVNDKFESVERRRQEIKSARKNLQTGIKL